MAEKLTQKEIEVYRLILKGFSRKQISNILGISNSTTCCHTQHIYDKKLVNSNRELLALRIKELEHLVKIILKENGMRTEDEIREQLFKLKELNCKEKTKMGKIIYGLGISIIRWVLGEIDEL